ncbi:MAG: hypothetical protein RBS81_08180 [Tenuifilaceae bacterium]|jgi:hypothetical protein|nr:hypothetical protein [Tenuifilaceae bacterium]
MRLLTLVLLVACINVSTAQTSSTVDTLQAISKIRLNYQEANKNLKNCKKKSTGNIDFAIGREEMDKYATGDDSWRAEETTAYYLNQDLVLFKQNIRDGAYQTGDTKTYREYYVKNDTLYFFFEREFFYTNITEAFNCYATECRIYLHNNAPIRILEKKVTWTDGHRGVNEDDFIKTISKEIQTAENKSTNIYRNHHKLYEAQNEWERIVSITKNAVTK